GSMGAGGPARTGRSRPAGVIATRYSWFFSSFGTPTFMTASPFSRPGPRAPLPGDPVPGGRAHPSAFTCPGFPELREATVTGGVRGQDTHRCHPIVQFTRQE